MYKIIFTILSILILFLILYYCRKRRILCKISNMSLAEKSKLLNDLAEPFGFCYDSVQDIFSARTDAWQREFGYGTLYDLAAPSMNMILDTEPIYFHYQEKTWLIQFWKGQYGITSGAEIGIYHADSVIPPMLRSQTIFQSASEKEMLPMSIRLYSGGKQMFYRKQEHWWLTGFLIGKWTQPSDLTAEYSIVFPDTEMCDSFLISLIEQGYGRNEVERRGNRVWFCFSEPKIQNHSAVSDWQRSYVLWKNRMFCRIYEKCTGHFSTAADRLLYLYYYLPSVFSRTICLRTFKKEIVRNHISENRRRGK